METPEQQAEKVKKENQEVIDRTIKIPLTKKQLAIISEMKTEQQGLRDKLSAVAKKEQDLVTMMLQFKDIEDEEIESVQLGDNCIIVVKKKEEKPETPLKKENLEVVTESSNGKE